MYLPSLFHSLVIWAFHNFQREFVSLLLHQYPFLFCIQIDNISQLLSVTDRDKEISLSLFLLISGHIWTTCCHLTDFCPGPNGSDPFFLVPNQCCLNAEENEGKSGNSQVSRITAWRHEGTIHEKDIRHYFAKLLRFMHIYGPTAKYRD